MFFLQITYGLSTNCYGICGMVRYILLCQMGNVMKELCITIQLETVLTDLCLSSDALNGFRNPKEAVCEFPGMQK